MTNPTAVSKEQMRIRLDELRKACRDETETGIKCHDCSLCRECDAIRDLIEKHGLSSGEQPALITTLPTLPDLSYLNTGVPAKLLGAESSSGLSPEDERVKIDNLCQQVEYCFGYFIMNPGIQSSAEFKKAKIEIQKYLRSRLSQPQPARVTREQIKKWFPCRCEKAWTSRGLTMPGCPYHDTLWEELLEDLGHIVEGGEGGKG
jgi:hypothetical protein